MHRSIHHAVIVAALAVVGTAACSGDIQSDDTAANDRVSTTTAAVSDTGKRMTYPMRPISVDIARRIDIVAAFLTEPNNFTRWASGLGTRIVPGTSGSGAEPGEWVADTPQGKVFVRFSPRNDFGVADHRVRRPGGATVTNPLRAVANADGTTVTFTLFRTPVNDSSFESDAQSVRHDLSTLKSLLEGE